jgi:hypothetical protein
MKKRLFILLMGFKLFNMKLFLFTLLVTFGTSSQAQITPTILIDNQPIKIQGETSLPYWIGAGKVLTLGQDAISASVLEFHINNANMEFNQAIHVTSTGTVPTGKIWKIEAIGIGNNTNYNSFSNFSNTTIPTIFTSPKTFSTPGTYSWTVPPGVTSICIEAWGAGGNGGAGLSGGQSAGGGGGGGYGYQCFTVIPGTQYTVIVGSGGSGSSTSSVSSTIGSLISVLGGGSGTNATLNTSGTGGTGGTSSASFNITGINGNDGVGVYAGGSGGKGANGGNGGNGGSGSSSSSATSGTFPGGGGGGGSGGNYFNQPGGGASGQIKIYF